MLLHNHLLTQHFTRFTWTYSLNLSAIAFYPFWHTFYFNFLPNSVKFFFFYYKLSLKGHSSRWTFSFSGKIACNFNLKSVSLRALDFFISLSYPSTLCRSSRVNTSLLVWISFSYELPTLLSRTCDRNNSSYLLLSRETWCLSVS